MPSDNVQGLIHSERKRWQNSSTTTLMSSNQFSFPAYSQFNTNYRLYPNTDNIISSRREKKAYIFPAEHRKPNSKPQRIQSGAAATNYRRAGDPACRQPVLSETRIARTGWGKHKAPQEGGVSDRGERVHSGLRVNAVAMLHECRLVQHPRAVAPVV